MNLSAYEARHQVKTEDERYREAARRMLPPGSVVRQGVAVNRDASNTGAFFEVIVWVPKMEMESKP